MQQPLVSSRRRQRVREKHAQGSPRVPRALPGRITRVPNTDRDRQNASGNPDSGFWSPVVPQCRRPGMPDAAAASRDPGPLTGNSTGVRKPDRDAQNASRDPDWDTQNVLCDSCYRNVAEAIARFARFFDRLAVLCMGFVIAES